MSHDDHRTAAQVGLGLTVAGVVSFFFAVPSGRLADRIGPRRMWALGAAAEALLYLAWPWIGGFFASLTMMILLEIVRTAGRSGRGAYTIDVFAREERVRSQAFMRSPLNIGFTFGALVGGLALAFDDNTVIRAVPVLTAVVLGCNALLISRLPDAARGIDSVSRSLRAARVSAGFVVLSCAIVLVTHDTLGWATIALVWLGHVTVTGPSSSSPRPAAASSPSSPTRPGSGSTRAPPTSTSPSARCGHPPPSRSWRWSGAPPAGS
ncbi:MAG: MFS transporter [Nocardioides sp.]